MKRQIYSVILLITFTVPATGFYCWLLIRKGQVKQEVQRMMGEGLKQEELKLLKFNADQAERLIRWEHPGEFEFRGEMYDVFERGREGDTLYFWCWRDREESDLNRQMEAVACPVHLSDHPLVRGHLRLTGYMQAPFLITSMEDSGGKSRDPAILQAVIINHYQSIFRNPPDPPPRIIQL